MVMWAVDNLSVMGVQQDKYISVKIFYLASALWASQVFAACGPVGATVLGGLWANCGRHRFLRFVGFRVGVALC